MIRLAIVTLIALINAALCLTLWARGCNAELLSRWINPFAGMMLAMMVPFATAMVMAFRAKHD